MKLKTLLPIVTVASVVSIVTPLVASCGGYKQYKIPTPDEIKDYKFVEQKGGLMKEEDATKVYFSDVKKNKKIFVDDYIKCFGGNAEEHYSESLAIKDVNPEEGRITTKDTFKSINNNGSSKSEEIYTYELINIKWDVEYVLLSDTEDSAWVVKINIHEVSDLKQDTKWAYIFTGKKYNPRTDKYEQERWIMDSDSDEDELKDVQEVLVKYSENMPSYYLAATGLAID